MGFGDLKTDAGLAGLNGFLEKASYIVGYTPSIADHVVFAALGKQPDGAKYPHAARWYRHITSYGAEAAKFPGTKKDVKEYGPSGAAAKTDDDDVDLFGSDDEEEDEEAAKIREARLAAYAAKKEKKPTIIAKSSVLFDVKPWDDETDMKELEAKVRSITMEGLLWGTSKLVEVGYGIKKLQIVTTIVDSQVSTEELTETLEGFEDFVQSVDIAAFNKI